VTSTTQVANLSVATAGTVTTASQPNITSLGSLTGLTLSANSDITMSGTGSQLSGANVVNATYLTGTLTTAAQPNITSVGTLTSLTVTGNVTANNFVANTIVKTTAVIFSSLPTASTAGAGARAFITDGNLVATGNFGSLVTGTGSVGNSVPVYSDGTNWRIG
jgi:hypothetical protein